MAGIARSSLRQLPLAAAILLRLATANAATIAVTDPSEGSVPGECTIADAVFAVNNATAKNACVAGNGINDTIDLSAFTAPTTIVFTLPTSADGNSALELDKPAVLRAGTDAQGNPLVTLRRSTQSGTPFRVVAAKGSVTLRGITITGGSLPARGAGIYARAAADVTLDHAVVSGNNSGAASGGGISADCGNVVLLHSTVSGNTAGKNGGGVYLSDYDPVTRARCVNEYGDANALTLDHSVVSGNHAASRGGGAYGFAGPVTVRYSTIDSNVAGTLGNPPTNEAGGGLYAGSYLSLLNSTVSNNSTNGAGGGFQAYYTEVTNTTLSGNYGAVDGGGGGTQYLVMSFSTVVSNTSTSAYGVGGLATVTATVVGSILAQNSRTNINAEEFAGSYDIIPPGPNEPQLPPFSKDCDPMLGPLANNGGPTLTRLPAAGSCAINAGPAPDSVATDQRGTPYLRVFGSASDIGAIEVQTGSDRIFYNGFDT